MYKVKGQNSHYLKCSISQITMAEIDPPEFGEPYNISRQSPQSYAVLWAIYVTGNKAMIPSIICVQFG